MIKKQGLIEVPLLLFLSIDVIFGVTLLRYLKYLLPVYLITCYFLFSNLRVIDTHKWYVEKLIFFYLICISLNYSSFYFETNFYFKYVSESFFILAPLVSIWVISKLISINDVLINRIFLTLFISYLIKILLFSEELILDKIPNSWDDFMWIIFNSEFGLESSASFMFGLFANYYLAKKKKLYFFLACFGAILAFKRIALLALFLGGIIYFSSMNFRINRYKNSVIFLIVLINIIAVYSILYFIDDTQTLSSIVDLTGFSINHLTMGRQEIYSAIINKFGFPNIFLGIGLGHTSYSLSLLFNNVGNIHSDLLKFIYEFGIMLFVLWIYFLYRISFISAGSISNIAYVNIVFLTDNVLIYFFFMLITYLLALNWIQNLSSNSLNEI